MKRRNGFTLIELLVVIGIIMVLVAMLTYGYRSLNKAAAGRETHAELKVCKGMLVEYEGRNGLAGIEFFSNTSPLQQPDPGAPPQTPRNFPVYVDPSPTLDPSTFAWVGTAHTPPWPSLQLTDLETSGTGGTLTDMGDKSTDPQNPSPRYYSVAVPATLDVMYVLMRIPANQTLAQAMQSKRVLEPIPPKGGPNPPANPVSQGVMLLDGWGNPIVFVPRGGIHVNVLRPNTSGQMVPTLSVVRSTGTFDATAGDPPMAGNERPFFASAGQDGDFTQGDDNAYSFSE